MMYSALYEYLLMHEYLPLPGLGSFHLDRIPAEADFPNKLINAPIRRVSWSDGGDPAADHLWKWIAHYEGIGLHEAKHRLEKFIYQLKNGLAAGDKIDWKGMGKLERGLGGQIRFTARVDVGNEAAVPAQKVLRQRAEHTVRVGEEERTSQEMSELLSEKPGRHWKAWPISAIILTVLAVAAIFWHFNHPGSGTGNRQGACILTTDPASYRQLP